MREKNNEFVIADPTQPLRGQQSSVASTSTRSGFRKSGLLNRPMTVVTIFHIINTGIALILEF